MSARTFNIVLLICAGVWITVILPCLIYLSSH